MKSYNSTSDLPSKLAVFPLTGAVLFPQTQLPLNIFEPRYIQMINEVLSSPNRIMGMIQPNLSKDDPNSKNLKKKSNNNIQYKLMSNIFQILYYIKPKNI